MKLLIGFYVLILPCALYGVISFSLEQKAKHVVLTLGDCHNEEFDEVNEKHIKKIGKFLKNYGTEKRIAFYYEQPEEDSESKLEESKYIKAKSFETLESLIPELKDSSIVFKPYDPRKSESDKIHDYFRQLYNMFSYSYEERKKSYSLFKENQNAEIQSDLLSLREYFQYLMKAEVCIKIWRDEYSKFTKEYELLDNKLTIFNDSKSEIKAKFGNNENKLLVAAMLDEVSEERLPTKLDQLSDLMLRRLDYTYADAGFLKTCLEEKNCSIFLLGKLHQESLYGGLRALGYKNIEYVAALELANEEKKEISYQLPADFVPKLLNSITYVMLSSYHKRSEKGKKEESSQCLIL